MSKTIYEEALEYLKPFRWEDEKAKESYELMKQALKERDTYFQALCDIEKGEDVRKVLERTLT